MSNLLAQSNIESIFTDDMAPIARVMVQIVPKAPSAFAVCVGGISKRFPATESGYRDAMAFAAPFGGHVLTIR